MRGSASAIDIRFAIRTCGLGLVLVAATKRGLCAILFGNGREDLMNELRKRFPGAALREPGAAFDAWVQKVVSLIEAPWRSLDLPLDLGGTAFQQRVWRALRDIPAGTTLGYGELAERIGQPRAARAVAQACASNALAVVVPCHRVVRSDGADGGYRWGAARKRALLAREARARE